MRTQRGRAGRAQHVEMGNAVFQVRCGSRCKSVRRVERLQVRLRTELDRATRPLRVHQPDAFAQQRMRQSSATKCSSDNHTADARFGITQAWGQHAQVSRQRGVIGDTQHMQHGGIGIFAIQFGIGALLLHHKHIRAQPQQRIQLHGAQLRKPQVLPAQERKRQGGHHCMIAAVPRLSCDVMPVGVLADPPACDGIAAHARGQVVPSRPRCRYRRPPPPTCPAAAAAPAAGPGRR